MHVPLLVPKIQFMSSDGTKVIFNNSTTTVVTCCQELISSRVLITTVIAVILPAIMILMCITVRLFIVLLKLVHYLVNYLVWPHQQDAHRRGLGLSGSIHEEAHPIVSNFS